MTFSRRVPADIAPNRLSATLSRLRRNGTPWLDLTASNPTRVGLNYDAIDLSCLADPESLVYAPEPLGRLDAREAVAGDYARRGLRIPSESIVLTASTSEAYSLLFKLLCDPGDEVLIPRPSYPLFDHLTRLDGVTAVPYELEYHGSWTVDQDNVARGFSARTRALLLVNPNNPTGSFVSQDDVERMAAQCRAHEAAVISDEVFADYALHPDAGRLGGALLERHDVLGFTLGGLSKSIGLPQLKLAWIVLSGAPADVEAARARLEIVADTYLSVATPIQVAAARLLAAGVGVREQIQHRIRTNHARLQQACGAAPSCRLLNAEGGWSAILQVPSIMSEEDLVVTLLEQDGVLAHPGYFFDFARESFVILSLLTPEAIFDEGVRRLLRRVEPS